MVRADCRRASAASGRVNNVSGAAFTATTLPFFAGRFLPPQNAKLAEEISAFFL
jgi:hypothetical protein